MAEADQPVELNPLYHIRHLILQLGTGYKPDGVSIALQVIGMRCLMSIGPLSHGWLDACLRLYRARRCKVSVLAVHHLSATLIGLGNEVMANADALRWHHLNAPIVCPGNEVMPDAGMLRLIEPLALLGIHHLAVAQLRDGFQWISLRLRRQSGTSLRVRDGSETVLQVSRLVLTRMAWQGCEMPLECQ